MAPHGEAIPNMQQPPRLVKGSSKPNFTSKQPQRLSKEGLQRAVSDLSFELSKEAAAAAEMKALPPISEVEEAKCECCGMSEECTPGYIERVKAKFSGKWICGLCSEAVKEEVEKNGGGRSREEALSSHMSACVRFNKFGRAYPVLFQAQAMREILKKSTARAKSVSPRDQKAGLKPGGIARSSSCIPAITRGMNDFTIAN
ncbi:uncharacterized protein LOC127795468 [Diospyros lotus]|uniref:uncharacterized protein LOC127795468 n=1 Tax=Diospyros lotus TaxID=55363 RepID=UPI0022543280|nr:uncharacterized protein LOC127795468 [Diospyros lotus]